MIMKRIIKQLKSGNMNFKINFKIIVTVIIIIATLFAALTMMASPQDTVYLEEILIKSQRQAGTVSTNISGNVLTIENPYDVGGIFINQAGFGVEKRGNYGMEPVLRGFKYSQLNVLIDGGIFTTNACPNRMDPAISQVASEEIQKIEIIKGPYCTRFGQCFGGTINVVNKRPDRFSGNQVSGQLLTGYQTNGNNYFGNLLLTGVKGKFDYSINASYKDHGNYKSGSGMEIASSFRRYGYALKVGFSPNDQHRFQLSWRQSKAMDVMYAGLPMDAEHDLSSIVALDYAAGKISDKINSLKFKVYGSFVDHVMNNYNRPAYQSVHARSPVNATVLGGRGEIGIAAGANNILFAGIDFKQTSKDGFRERIVYTNTCTGQTFDPPKQFIDKIWQDAHSTNPGLFLENKNQINDRLTWTAGLRLDFFSFEAKDPGEIEEIYDGNIKPDDRVDVSASTNLSWNLPDDFNIFFGVARAMRAPDLPELFINHMTIGMDAHEYVGNPQLKSEVNYQTDLRFEKRLEKVSFFGDLFFSHVQNYITAVVDTTLPRLYMPCNDPKFAKRFVNIDKAFLTGFETGMDLQLSDDLLFKLSVSYTYAQNTSLDEPLAEITPLTILGSLNYDTERFGAVLQSRIVDRQSRVAASFNETETPGFAVFDFRFSYHFLKRFEAVASVKNLLNKNYYEHLSRAYKGMDMQSLYFEPGRNFGISLRMTF
jgi:iron complex outermembrane recepter protein